MKTGFNADAKAQALTGRIASLWPLILTFAALGCIFGAFLATSLRSTPPLREWYAETALRSLLTFFVILVVPLALGRIRLQPTVRPWKLVALISMALSLVPALLQVIGRTAEANLIYRALSVPHNPTMFVDWSLTLQSMWCQGQGFDITDPANSCIRPIFYGPGLSWVPLPFYEPWVATVTGLLLCLAGTLAICIVARTALPIAGFFLLLGVSSASWLLLLERGNLDVIILVAGVMLSFLISRTKSIWPWALVALAIWLMGTWKYYPFAMGVLLLPAVRMKRGWLVPAGFLAATLAFIGLTLDSMRANAEGQLAVLSGNALAVPNDFFQLGRAIVVPRMSGLLSEDIGPPLATVLLVLLCIFAMTWGAQWIRDQPHSQVTQVNLATVGATSYLAVVLVGGFGYGFKGLP